MAGVTGLEPATSGVTGRHSNRLSYTPAALRSIRLASRDGHCVCDLGRHVKRPKRFFCKKLNAR